ncbi:membrane protein [Echinicola pacifica]|uniref:Membrane protein n=1 Tax=Echinicola pacifica TaxID=346377 RepID=A0A918UIE8_9BACT|nr:membrane protein [Echinicola pacifica]
MALILGLLVSIIGLLILVVTVFVNTQPQFGARPAGEDLERMSQSPHFSDGIFINSLPTTTGDLSDVFKVLPELLDEEGKVPHRSLPTGYAASPYSASDQVNRVTWYGHSAFLLELTGRKILIDPMFGEIPSPLPFGSKRFATDQPIDWSAFESIDILLISHDHYDHLDYPTILRIQEQVGLFITPLGVGSHLKHWGIPEEKIVELDWWQEKEVDGLSITACPARHFSGRGMTDRFATLWAGWSIKSEELAIYFSGDGGYGDHFKEIGQRLGPFDFAMVECGQYNEAWKDIHMVPEETVQAALDLQAKLSMPIHWGAFRLAPHQWLDPITRFENAAKLQSLPYITPLIGQTFQLGHDFPNTPWWLGL